MDQECQEIIDPVKYISVCDFVNKMVKRTRVFKYRKGTRKLRRMLKKGYTRPVRPTRYGLSSNVHAYQRWATPSTASFTTAESANSEKFTLDSLVNSSELTNLYDQYRIDKVTVYIRLMNNPDATYVVNNPPNNNYSNYFPKLWYYRDYDDSGTLTVSQMREVGKSKYKILRPNSAVKISLKPACLTQVYATAVTTGYAPKWNQRLDVGASNIPHYGLKWTVDAEGSALGAGSWYIRVEYKYHVTMFNSR